MAARRSDVQDRPTVAVDRGEVGAGVDRRPGDRGVARVDGYGYVRDWVWGVGVRVMMDGRVQWCELSRAVREI